MSNKEYEYIVKLLKRNIVCNNSGVGNSFYCNGFNNVTCTFIFQFSPFPDTFLNHSNSK